MIELTIDPEFRALIPPLTAGEQAQLEANLLAEGCRDPLVVWAGEPPADAAHHCQAPWVRQLPLGTMLEQVSWLCPGMGSLKDHVPHMVDLAQLAALAARVKEATS